jgi:hypothetical protein
MAAAPVAYVDAGDGLAATSGVRDTSRRRQATGAVRSDEGRRPSGQEPRASFRSSHAVMGLTGLPRQPPATRP